MRPFVRVLATLLVAVPSLLPAQGVPVSNSDDVVWYVDYTRGFLGRLDP